MDSPRTLSLNNYFDLGTFSRKISTSNTVAQLWFDRGFTWAYGFNHWEAVTCYEQAIAHDPSCAMLYWGAAYSIGPHYNLPWVALVDLKGSMARFKDMIQKAEEFAADGKPVEKALVKALATRLPPDDSEESLAASNNLYADAMRKVYEEFGDDLDVLVLTADALMNCAPWRLFEPRTAKPNLSTPVLEIRPILERGLKHKEAKDHPGLLHFIIHYFEMSSTPETALVAADRLRYLVPEGGHLQHMPSHIYVLVGDYRQAIDSNYKATLRDDKYFEYKADKGFNNIYRLHNLHSLIYAAMLAGQLKTALDACDRMEAVMTEEFVRIEKPAMADWTEALCGIRVHVLVRFGRWEELKNYSLPKDQKLYCVTTAYTHYGRAIAFAATGDLKKAEDEQALYTAAVKCVPPSRLLFPNTMESIFKIATAMLDGEIAYRRGDYDTAFDSLKSAIKADDSLIYGEPWGWMVPTRHSFAALALEQGRVEEAAEAYAEDLGVKAGLASAHQHPANIWSLRGYYDCLTRLGRDSEAHLIKPQLTLAAAVADIPVHSSCFCSQMANGSKETCDEC